MVDHPIQQRSSFGIESRSLGFLKCLSFLPAFMKKASDCMSSVTVILISCSAVGFREELELDWTAFSLLNWFSTNAIVPIAQLALIIEGVALFSRKVLNVSLISRFKCSMWRSSGMFLPRRPRTLMNWFQTSWFDSHGESEYKHWWINKGPHNNNLWTVMHER